jgi:hypothetical protein
MLQTMNAPINSGLRRRSKKLIRKCRTVLNEWTVRGAFTEDILAGGKLILFLSIVS